MDKKDFYARTMHTPDDPARARRRAALRETSKALLPLHRGLIDAAKNDYAAATTLAATPTQLVRLLTDDPFFSWLKPVTALIVDIDEMARIDFEPADVVAIADRIDRLFAANAEGEFAARYIPILQRDVDVAISHAALRQAVKKLRE
jgi:hypothetical protein